MGAIIRWISDRTPLGAGIEFLRRKQVPVHRHAGWYLAGGLTLLFFLVQIVSGVLLTLYYQPVPERAHESVASIMTEVRFGWVVRAVHKWSSHLVILFAVVHLLSKFFFRAYRPPRELTWVSGVLLLLILLGFAFTGHLLPWDTTGYFATQIGTEIPRSLPMIGPLVVGMLRGAGEYVDGATLTRMYSLHTVILPLLALGLIGFHILMNQYTGSASPAGVRATRTIPFLPDFVHRDALAWIGGVLLLFTLVLWFPPVLGPKADILASPPPGIHPEWYFLPLFQAINLLPGTIGGLNTEIFVNAGVGIFLALLILLPWIDRSPGSRDDRSGGTVASEEVGGPGLRPYIRTLGIVAILYGLFSIILTYVTR